MYYFAFQDSMQKKNVFVIIIISGKTISCEHIKMRKDILLLYNLFSCEIIYTTNWLFIQRSTAYASLQ